MENSNYEVVIVGGSYAGLSAGMALGRALRKVLIVDNGRPCNIQTPHSHNFLTQDGARPADIAKIANEQVMAYPTVEWLSAKAEKVTGSNYNFTVSTDTNKTVTAQKVLFATGVRDIMPDIPGFSACWGISVIHCPYCHGYEYKNKKTGILANGETAWEFAQLINQWTKELTIFTNGAPTFSEEIRSKIQGLGIDIVESNISSIDHEQGKLQHLNFIDGTIVTLDALYARLPFEQHSDIPEKLGCDMTEHGYLKIDDLKQTNIAGVYAAGDNASMMRAVSAAVAAGGFAGAIINKDLISGR
jgi:thioredoxin reductase